MADNPTKLLNENGCIVGKDPQTGDTIPIEFGAISPEQLRSDPPTAPFDWESLNYLLGDGYCINSCGTCFSGATAAQDAIDDILDNVVDGKVWIGDSQNNTANDGYTNVTLNRSAAMSVTIVGMGERSTIGENNGTAFSYIDPDDSDTQGIRLRMRDVRLNAGGGSTDDGLYLEHSNECFFDSVTVENAGRNAARFVGARRSTFNGCQFDDADPCLYFTDSATRPTSRIVYTGGTLVTTGDSVVEFAQTNGNSPAATSVRTGPVAAADNGAGNWLVSDGNTDNVDVSQIAGISGDTNIQAGDHIRVSERQQPAIYGKTLADTASEQLFPPNKTIFGKVMVKNKDSGEIGEVFCKGGASDTVIAADPDRFLSTTGGNVGTLNIFHDGSKYAIENQLGSQTTFALYFNANE